ncbi:class I glutamine amidotransferase-like protein [Flammula alnicola]|nr:class I glutamine amidotransferase-like protein [Flammula alnicola]
MVYKIALLVCGGLTGRAKEQNGDYLDIYTRYLRATVPTAIEFTLDPYNVTEDQAYPNEDEYHCIMLTGSAASAYENIEWINKLVAYIARVAETKPHIKIIGICFGHQIIARALGGECVPNGGKWEIGPTAVRLTELGKRIFGGGEELIIQQMHRDHVPQLPPDFHLLGSTELSPIQGMVCFAPNSSVHSPDSANLLSDSSLPLPPIQIITTQGHPEFTEPIVSAIVDQRTGVMSKEAVDDYTGHRKWRKDDGLGKIGTLFWKVIQGEL